MPITRSTSPVNQSQPHLVGVAADIFGGAAVRVGAVSTRHGEVSVTPAHRPEHMRRSPPAELTPIPAPTMIAARPVDPTVNPDVPPPSYHTQVGPAPAPIPEALASLFQILRHAIRPADTTNNPYRISEENAARVVKYLDKTITEHIGEDDTMIDLSDELERIYQLITCHSRCQPQSAVHAHNLSIISAWQAHIVDVADACRTKHQKWVTETSAKNELMHETITQFEALSIVPNGRSWPSSTPRLTTICEARFKRDAIKLLSDADYINGMYGFYSMLESIDRNATKREDAVRMPIVRANEKGQASKTDLERLKQINAYAEYRFEIMEFLKNRFLRITADHEEFLRTGVRAGDRRLAEERANYGFSLCVALRDAVNPHLEDDWKKQRFGDAWLVHAKHEIKELCANPSFGSGLWLKVKDILYDNGLPINSKDPIVTELRRFISTIKPE